MLLDEVQLLLRSSATDSPSLHCLLKTLQLLSNSLEAKIQNLNMAYKILYSWLLPLLPQLFSLGPFLERSPSSLNSWPLHTLPLMLGALFALWCGLSAHQISV
jgi:hypothetical protein